MNSVAPTATIFVTKTVFENEGVNHRSNFPAPNPKTKVAPKPTDPGRENSRPENIWPGKFSARKIWPGKIWPGKIWPDFVGLRCAAASGGKGSRKRDFLEQIMTKKCLFNNFLNILIFRSTFS